MADHKVEDLTPEDVAKGMAEGRYLLVDVREPNEVAVEAYPGAVVVPLSTFDPKAIPDPKGKTVVFTQGTTNERAMKTYNDEHKLGINFVPSKDHQESFLSVETGRAVAFPMDDILLYSLKASAKNPDDYVVLGEFLSDRRVVELPQILWQPLLRTVVLTTRPEG